MNGAPVPGENPLRHFFPLPRPERVAAWQKLWLVQSDFQQPHQGCVACGEPLGDDPSVLHVDHDHRHDEIAHPKVGENPLIGCLECVRGLIHQGCNGKMQRLEYVWFAVLDPRLLPEDLQHLWHYLNDPPATRVLGPRWTP